MGYITSRTVPWGSQDQIIRGVSTKLKGTGHEIGLEALWRTITCKEGASESVHVEAGHSMKTSISHSWMKDSRDDHLMPSKGGYLKIGQEFAGVLGNPFYKASLETQYAYSPNRWISITGGMRTGGLWMFNNSRSHFMDRFYLGGPNDVRGFKVSGLGPHDGDDSLGGEAFFASGVSLFSRLPRVSPETPLRLHLFANAGSVLPLDHTNVMGTAYQLVSKPSVAAGFGLAYCYSIARFELNFSLPLIISEGEGARKGIQFGVGLSFL